MLAARLKRWLAGPETKDGFGQSFLEDLRFLARMRACRRRETVWRPPTADEASRWDAHPIVGRFGDATIAVARVDGRDWVVRENDWYGWPDPARYPFFVLDGDRIWAATEFSQWPRAWGSEPG
jgi:hypothetical protein